MIAYLPPQLSAPYFRALAHDIVEAARLGRWTAMVDETGGNAERERDNVAAAKDAG